MPKCPECQCENPEGTPLCRECGATLPTQPAEATAQPSEDDAELLGLLDAGKKISAIKLYRERHGVGLNEAKAAVEALARQRGIADQSSPDDAELLELLNAGQKISAIKLYRERHGVGLKEAKDAVEALAGEHGIAAQGSGCAGMVLLAVTGLAAAAYCLLA